MKRTLLLTGLVVGLLSTSGIARATILCPLPNPDVINSAAESCTPKVYGTCTFVKQKANGNCLYDCPYTETCYALVCSPLTCACSPVSHKVTGTDRFKKGPYPVNLCPDANTFSPQSGDPVPPGTE